MNEQNHVARISIDIPEYLQQKLKALAAIHNQSMKAVVIKAIEKQIKLLENETNIITFKTPE